jgi:thioredoxin-related protein
MKSFNKAFTAALLGVVALLGVQTTAVQAAEEGWLVDFEEAKKLSKETGKPILMEFTGSDWCPPCKALHKAVLSQDVFKTEVPKSYILLKLDNPRDKSHQTDAEKKQYPVLAKKYGVRGVPTVMLVDDEGKPFHQQVGFGGDKAEKWVADIVAKSEIRAKRDSALEKAAAASGVEKAKLLDEAINLIDVKLAVATYGDVVAQIIELDEENEAGLKAKYVGLQNNVKFEEEMQGVMQASRGAAPEETAGKLGELVAKYKPSGEPLQMALYYQGFFTMRAGDKEKAKVLMEKAVAAAPDSRNSLQIKQIISQQFKD